MPKEKFHKGVAVTQCPYDSSVEDELRAELADPTYTHTSLKEQLRDEHGCVIPGCYKTTPINVD